MYVDMYSTYVCVCECICTYACMYVHMYVPMYVSTYVCMYIMYVHMDRWTNGWMDVRTYGICRYVCGYALLSEQNLQYTVACSSVCSLGNML